MGSGTDTFKLPCSSTRLTFANHTVATCPFFFCSLLGYIGLDSGELPHVMSYLAYPFADLPLPAKRGPLTLKTSAYDTPKLFTSLRRSPSTSQELPRLFERRNNVNQPCPSICLKFTPPRCLCSNDDSVPLGECRKYSTVQKFKKPESWTCIMDERLDRLILE